MTDGCAAVVMLRNCYSDSRVSTEFVIFNFVQIYLGQNINPPLLPMAMNELSLVSVNYYYLMINYIRICSAFK